VPLAFPFLFYIPIFQFKRGLCLQVPPNKISAAFRIYHAHPPNFKTARGLSAALFPSAFLFPSSARPDRMPPKAAAAAFLDIDIGACCGCGPPLTPQL
jgi:hypothetical protein